MGFAPEILIPVLVLLPCSRTTTPGTKPHEPTATSLHLAHHPPPPGATTVAASNFSLSLAANHSSPAALQFLSHQHRPNMFAPPPALPPPPPLTSSTLPVPGHPSGAAFSGKYSNLQSSHPSYLHRVAEVCKFVCIVSMSGTPTDNISKQILIQSDFKQNLI